MKLWLSGLAFAVASAIEDGDSLVQVIRDSTESTPVSTAVAEMSKMGNFDGRLPNQASLVNNFAKLTGSGLDAGTVQRRLEEMKAVDRDRLVNLAMNHSHQADKLATWFQGQQSSLTEKFMPQLEGIRSMLGDIESQEQLERAAHNLSMQRTDPNSRLMRLLDSVRAEVSSRLARSKLGQELAKQYGQQNDPWYKLPMKETKEDHFGLIKSIAKPQNVGRLKDKPSNLGALNRAGPRGRLRDAVAKSTVYGAFVKGKAKYENNDPWSGAYRIPNFGDCLNCGQVRADFGVGLKADCGEGLYFRVSFPSYPSWRTSLFESMHAGYTFGNGMKAYAHFPRDGTLSETSGKVERKAPVVGLSCIPYHDDWNKFAADRAAGCDEKEVRLHMKLDLALGLGIIKAPEALSEFVNDGDASSTLDKYQDRLTEKIDEKVAGYLDGSKVEELHDDVQQRVDELQQAAEALPDNVAEAAEAVPEKVAELARAYPENVLAKAAALPEDLVAMAKAYPEKVAEKALALPDKVLDLAKAYPKSVLLKAAALPHNVMKNIEKAHNDAISKYMKGVEDPNNHHKKLAKGAVDAVEEVRKTAVDGAEKVRQGAVDAVDEVRKTAVDGLDEVRQGAIDAVDGVRKTAVDGVEEVRQGAIDAVDEVRKTAVDGVKEVKDAAEAVQAEYTKWVSNAKKDFDSVAEEAKEVWVELSKMHKVLPSFSYSFTWEWQPKQRNGIPNPNYRDKPAMTSSWLFTYTDIAELVSFRKKCQCAKRERKKVNLGITKECINLRIMRIKKTADDEDEDSEADMPDG